MSNLISAYYKNSTSVLMYFSIKFSLVYIVQIFYTLNEFSPVVYIRKCFMPNGIILTSMGLWSFKVQYFVQMTELCNTNIRCQFWRTHFQIYKSLINTVIGLLLKLNSTDYYNECLQKLANSQICILFPCFVLFLFFFTWIID